MAYSLRRELRKFNRALVKEAKAVENVMVKSLVKRTLRELYTEVKQRSPVDTGHYRKNWQIADDPEPMEILGEMSVSFGAPLTSKEELSLARALSGVDTGKLKELFITNVVPYAEVIEYGEYPPGPKVDGGFSSQAPGGVMRVSLASIRSRLKAGDIRAELMGEWVNP